MIYRYDHEFNGEVGAEEKRGDLDSRSEPQPHGQPRRAPRPMTRRLRPDCVR
jgi:hypothetical protein